MFKGLEFCVPCMVLNCHCLVVLVYVALIPLKMCFGVSFGTTLTLVITFNLFSF